MEKRIITLLGGTGFVGRYVVKRLAASGYRVRVVSRHPDSALYLKTSGTVGQIVPMYGDIGDAATLAGLLEGSYAVINLVGILFESGKQNFSRIQAHGVEKLAQAAKAAGVERFIHVSALGVDKASQSAYARSKMLGEKAVQQAFPTATILRPSVIFGPEDHFFNMFAAMASLAPFLPLIGGGTTRFQPVYVCDVAEAIEACITRSDVQGQIYELGGPGIYTFREIMEYILRTTRKLRPLVNVPLNVASIMGLFGEWLPRPLLTRDQVKLLKYDNVVEMGARTLADLGVSPSAVEVIVPQYLARFHKKAA